MGTSLTHTFGYDSSTRQLKSITYSGAKTGSITIETSAAGKIKSKLIKFADGVKYNYDYVKNDNNTGLNEIIQLKFGDNTATINKDGLGRIEGRYIKTGEEVRLSDTYDYTTGNKTINYVNHKSGRSESYNYDARKFISRYTDINGNAH